MNGIIHEVVQHSLSDIVSMGASFIATRLFYPKATLIRRPFHIRKKRAFDYGSGFTCGHNCRIEIFGDGVIRLGSDCHIGDNVHIAALGSILIGDDCLFASKVFITDIGHGTYSGECQSSPDTPPNDRELTSDPVEIGPNVWLGENVCVLGGVTIGAGSIIGANATVTRDIPPRCIAVGSPARPIKAYDDETNCWTAIG